MIENENKERSAALPKKITGEDLAPQRDKKSIFLYVLRTVLGLILSSGLLAFAAYCLIAPNHFTIGGITGISIMISYASGGKIPQSILLFSINFPLLVLAFFFVKKKFAILSVANIILQSIWLAIFENCGMPTIVFPDSGTRIFAAIAAGVCIGASIAIAFKLGGSTGGVDVLAVMIQKKFPAPSIAWMIFMVSATVILSSFFVFYDRQQDLALNLLPIMLSLFEIYVESKTNDAMTNGFQSAIEFRIVTDKPEEISLAVMHELSRGVTELPATGMYTHQQKSMLVCVVSRRQVAALRRIMKQHDPNAFAVMSGVSQVLGLGFFHSED